MTRGEPQWGVLYKRDTYPQTYPCSWENATTELDKYWPDAVLMVMYKDEWVEVLHD